MTMIPHILHVYSMNLGYAKRLVRDLSEDQMCAQPHGVVNHPAWSLGHLAVASDHLATTLGLASELPAGWADPFKTGGIPSPDPRLFPGRDELLPVMYQPPARVAHAGPSVHPPLLA